MTVRIIELEVPRFKDMKRLRYNAMLFKFSQDSQAEFEIFRNIASKIELVI
jgi:hypothetical protein